MFLSPIILEPIRIVIEYPIAIYKIKKTRERYWFSPLINGLLITLVTKINKNLYKFASANVD